jgi:hypothetical protein
MLIAKKYFNKIFRLFIPAESPAILKKRYDIPEALNMKIRFTKDGYFVLTCDELPGLITEAKNGKQLIEMLNDAVLTYFDVPKIEGDVVYNQLNIDGYGTFMIQQDSKIAQTI